MPPLTIDGKVDPAEYEERVDGSAHKMRAHPDGTPQFSEVYYSFDGSALHFGIRRSNPAYKITGVSLWIDADCNGCEVGDLLVAAEPEHRLAEYGIYKNPGQLDHVAGNPPDSWRAGCEVRCFADGDTEMKLVLSRQYANGLEPNPLPSDINVNVTVKATGPDGKPALNFLHDAALKTFVIGFE